MVTRSLALLSVLLGSTVAAAAAPPVNDAFEQALTLPPEVGVVGTLTAATADPLQCKPTPDVATPVAVWYRVVAASDGTLVFDTSGSERNTLHLCVVKTPLGGMPTFVTTAGPKPLGAAADGDAIAVASVSVATGDAVTVGVMDDVSRIDDTEPEPFQINTHALPPIVPGSENYLVLSPNASYMLGVREFDDPRTFTIPLPNVINVAPFTVDEPKVQPGFPAGTLELIPARKGPLAPETGVAMKLTSVGNGPAFGQVGTFVRDASVGLFAAGQRFGRAVQRVYLLSLAADTIGNDLSYSLSRRSDAGRLGDVRRFQVLAKNNSTATVRGCFPFGYPSAYAVGASIRVGSGWDFRFRAFDPKTGKALAGWNSPVAIGKGRTVRFDIEQRVAALGFHMQPILPICTDPYIFPSASAFSIGAGTIAGFGYRNPLADALVEPVGLPSGSIMPEPGKSADVVYTVRNYGTKRNLTVYPSDRFPGMPTEGFEPAPVSRLICQANAAGRCLGSFRSTLTLDFTSGQTRTFRVRWTRNGDIPSGQAGLFVNVLQGGNPVGVAGISIVAPN